MKKVFFFSIFMLSISLFSQSADSLFVTANELYKNENFEEAIKKYKQIETKNIASSELYYNLGNSYYKLNKVGPAIYYYEKALQLNPLNKDVQNNLIFAQRLALDSIEPLPETLFQKLNKNILQKLSYNQWAIVVVVLSILGSLLFLLYYFAETPIRKRVFFITSVTSFLLLIFSVLITYNQYNYSISNKEAIVFAEKTEVRNAPTLNSEEVFTLHEGAKVVVLDQIDDWKKIRLADGKIGWIIASEIKLLNDF